MEREKLLKEIKQYFDIRELVGPVCYNLHGDRAWKFLDTNLLHCLLIIRKELKKPITINSWKWNGSFSQRGLRDTTQQLVKDAFSKNKCYLSAHLLGKAIDFDVKGMTAIEVREWVMNNQNIFPCKIRMEKNLNGKPISWVHLDTIWEGKNPQVYQFDV